MATAPAPNAAVLRYDLEAELPALRSEAPKHSHKNSARTLVHQAELRIVLMSMCEGATQVNSLAEGGTAIHVLRGQFRVRLDGDSVVELSASQGVALERGVPYQLEAVSDGDVLLTIGWSAEHRSTQSRPS